MEIATIVVGFIFCGGLSSLAKQPKCEFHVFNSCTVNKYAIVEGIIIRWSDFEFASGPGHGSSP